MLKITKPAPNRVDIEIDGALDADAMRRLLDDLIAKSQDVRNGRMLYRMPDFHMPTLGAFAVEFGRLPKLFAMIARFDRCAFLSDAAWLRRAAEIEGAVIPGLKIRSFELHDVEAAEAWLAEAT